METEKGESLNERLSLAAGLPDAQVGLLLGTGTLVSEDLSCVCGGILAARGEIGYGLATVACFLGIWIGDLLLYALGRFGGMPLLRRAPLRWWVSDRRVEQGRQLFCRHGGKLVFSSRFLPGSRFPIYVASGIVRYPFWRFAGYMALACAIWTPLLVGFSLKLGDVLLRWLAVYEKAAWIGVVAVVAIVWLAMRVLEFGVTHRGRRLLFSKWSRLLEWEFWPMWAVYPPVLAYLVWLAIRHRSLTVFALTNPAIPLGGLALESKSDILRRLSATPESAARVACFAVIEPGPIDARLAALETFRRERGLEFPVVLKPDQGERGQGVAVIASVSEARDYLRDCAHPVIAQEHVGGLEFGVFYHRHPDEETGAIPSITEKRMPSVTGDGERTLEQLILDDARAVKMARFFLDKWANRLAWIPAAGELVRLTELGTHCRGAVFLDGRRHETEALREAIDRLSRAFEGFHFGRYDIRVPSVEDFEAGRKFKVLELNGVSSEPTHIYAPGTPIWSAWRDLFRLWRTAFAIGAANRARGMRPPTVREVAGVIRAHREHAWFEAPPVAGSEDGSDESK
ncbi:MAG: VTT domain-containing protein [Verrucomicrobiae bacterium]|nr:VTT domain-containing protein [Verrucomicrobiae bacterium]